MKKIILNEGDRFGKLTVIREVETKKRSKRSYVRYFLCKCDCGNETIVSMNNLRNGVTRSCGCLRRELNRGFIDDCLDKPLQSRLHNIWLAMRNRCNNKKGKEYRNYTSKGITVCDEWKDFNVFFKWAINNGYHPSLSINRIDGNKGYSPENCRWSTAMEQANNIRTNIHLTLNGTTHTIPEWSRLLKVSPRPLYMRYYNGWTDEKILTTPIIKKTKKTNRVMKLIDKSALVAEIKNRRDSFYSLSKSCEKDTPAKAGFYAQAQTLEGILSFLNTFKVKEVDLEKEIDKVWDTNYEDFGISADVFYSVARHFFELGIRQVVNESIIRKIVNLNDEAVKHYDAVIKKENEENGFSQLAIDLFERKVDTKELCIQYVIENLKAHKGEKI